jgi:hypothetical protein
VEDGVFEISRILQLFHSVDLVDHRRDRANVPVCILRVSDHPKDRTKQTSRSPLTHP